MSLTADGLRGGFARAWRRFRGLPAWGAGPAWPAARPPLGAISLLAGHERSPWNLLIARLLVALLLAGSMGIAGCSQGAAPGSSAASEQITADRPTAVPSPSQADRTATSTPTATAMSTSAVQPPPVTAVIWTVVQIIDGDTVDVRSSEGIEERVRVIGIDTPERGECGFADASEALSRLVRNQRVTLVAGACDNRDRYDRILRYLDVGSTDAGLELI